MQIEYGQAGTYWDAFPSKEQMEDLGLRSEITHISVEVNVETGQIELNAGYEPRSPENRDEEDIFSTYHHEIRDLIRDHARSSKRMLTDPDYDALRADEAPRPRM